MNCQTNGNHSSGQQTTLSQAINIARVVNIANLNVSNGTVCAHSSLTNSHQNDIMTNGHNSDTSNQSPTNDSYKLQNSLPFKRETIDSDVNQY
jgi:hypothetical protein